MSARAARDADLEAIPALGPHEGSWVATGPDGKVIEFFYPANVRKAQGAGWKIETIGEYLGRINAGMRAKAACVEAARLYKLGRKAVHREWLED